MCSVSAKTHARRVKVAAGAERSGYSAERVGRPSETIDDGELGEGARMFVRGADLGRYVVLERLGAGSMGVVVAAFDTQLDRKVALKFLLGQGGDEPAEARARLLREARALAMVSHPNVVAVHDVGTIEGCVYVAMELVAGRTLRRWLAEKERSVDEVLEVFCAVGRGLAAVHAAGLVHRDVKPDNVMIGDDGSVRLMDFGLVRAREDDDEAAPDLTRRGAVVGTPAYMSPEQHADRAVDARSDQFAFCVALYEALYGKRPFSGATLPELVRNVGAGEPIQPGPERGVEPSIHAAILRGLAAEPSARFASMDDLVAALARDAGRPRRAVIVGAVVVGLALVVGLASIVAQRRREAACATAAAALGEVWNDASRANVTDAAVARSLDEWSARWSDVAHTVCLESRVETTLTLEQRDRAEHCLERGKQRFAAWVEVASEGVARTLELRAPEACLEPDAIEGVSRVAKPSALRRALDRVHVLHLVGRHEDALVLLDDLQVDEPATRAELQYLRGAVAHALHLDADAQTSFEAALLDATRTGQDALVARAAAGLARVAAVRAPKSPEVARWLRHADAALDRSGSTDPELLADIHDAHAELDP